MHVLGRFKAVQGTYVCSLAVLLLALVFFYVFLLHSRLKHSTRLSLFIALLLFVSRKCNSCRLVLSTLLSSLTHWVHVHVLRKVEI